MKLTQQDPTPYSPGQFRKTPMFENIFASKKQSCFQKTQRDADLYPDLIGDTIIEPVVIKLFIKL